MIRGGAGKLKGRRNRRWRSASPQARVWMREHRRIGMWTMKSPGAIMADIEVAMCAIREDIAREFIIPAGLLQRLGVRAI